jgi:zinc finger protein
MTKPFRDDPKSDGAAFDDFFDSIGKKAEHLTINEQNEKQESPAATNGTEPASSSKDKPEEEDQRVVDEIESLCMNCRENVREAQFFPLTDC